MTQRPLSAADIRRLFGELASELDAAGQRAEIFLVGGAAIALSFDGRRATRGRLLSSCWKRSSHRSTLSDPPASWAA
jgi:hypothetical protein